MLFRSWRAGHVGASSPGPVWTIDLPGHGDSDGDVLNPPDAAQHMDDAINQLGIAPGDVHARGYGAAVAMSWVLGTSRSRGASAWVRQASFHLHEVILRNDAERVMRTNFPNSKYLSGKNDRSRPWWQLWNW